MKLNELLTEAYKVETTPEEAWDLLNKHCRDALKDLKRPIVRGMSAKDIGETGVITGEDGGRKSANTQNFYTIILDKVLGDKGFPLRSKSIICANWQNSDYVESFGTPYAIIPFDGVKIGVCPSYDMWETTIDLPFTKIEFAPRDKLPIADINRIFKDADIDEKVSFDGLMKQIFLAIKQEQPNFEKFPKGLTFKQLIDMFDEAYSKPFKFATTATSEIYNDGEEREVWVSGKCVAIKLNVYLKMVKDYHENTKQ